jgi:signal transduction histidine kinase
VDGEKYLIEIGKSLTSIFTAKQNISKVILVFLAFIIIITLLTDLQYTRKLLRPLDEISKKLGSISNPASFDKVPVETKTTDFHQLDDALIKLMNHIDGLFQKEKDITVNISHELLTPISIIRSKLENILLRNDQDQEISEKIEESLKTLQRLHSLVNSLLFIARIESLQYLRDDSFTVNDVLRVIIEELKPIAEDASVNLQGEFDKDYFIVNANRSLIFSMFFNVVNNAVKNTPCNGSVVARSSIQDDNRFVVTISDTGKGMTEDQLTNLFSRFKTRKVTDGNGSGIGLAIAKTIADLHKIEITVSTKTEKGTTFSFIFS